MCPVWGWLLRWQGRCWWDCCHMCWCFRSCFRWVKALLEDLDLHDDYTRYTKDAANFTEKQLARFKQVFCVLNEGGVVFKDLFQLCIGVHDLIWLGFLKGIEFAEQCIIIYSTEKAVGIEVFAIAKGDGL